MRDGHLCAVTLEPCAPEGPKAKGKAPGAGRRGHGRGGYGELHPFTAAEISTFIITRVASFSSQMLTPLQSAFFLANVERCCLDGT